MHEVFLGGLPRAASGLHALQLGLHEALLAFSGTEDRSAVRLRLHTKPCGEGLGFGFAWLPDAEAAARLVAASQIYCTVGGQRVRAGIRAARGRVADDADQRRPPPISEPCLQTICIAVVTTWPTAEERVAAALEAWGRYLRRFEIGLELQVLRSPGLKMPRPRSYLPWSTPS